MTGTTRTQAVRLAGSNIHTWISIAEGHFMVAFLGMLVLIIPYFSTLSLRAYFRCLLRTCAFSPRPHTLSPQYNSGPRNLVLTVPHTAFTVRTHYIGNMFIACVLFATLSAY